MTPTGVAPEQPGVLRLTKHHGAGNDFLVVLDADGSVSLAVEEVRVLCDRHRGIGADGLLRMTKADGGALAMELRNADGGEAEMSGNGIRCAVQAAVDAGWVVPGTVTVSTAAGVRHVDYRKGERPGLGYARVAMGEVRLGPDALDALPGDLVHGVRAARTVDVGNPHVVVLGEAVDDAVVRRAGPVLERSEPDGANVEFVWGGPGEDALTLRVWERGVGETLACGTGACAAAAAAHSWGVVGSTVRVHSPGGTLEVELRGRAASLAGPTQKVADIVVPAAIRMALLEGDDAAGALETVTSRL
jgi:diaminopimelate epimerase